MLGLIITLLIVGLIAGALARLLVPGRDSIGIGGTILLGSSARSSADSSATCSSHEDAATASCSRPASSDRSSARSSRC